MTGQRRVDPLAAIFIRQNQSGNGQRAKQEYQRQSRDVNNTRQGSRSQAQVQVQVQVQNSKVRQSGVKHRDSRMKNAQKCQPGQEQDFAVSRGVSDRTRTTEVITVCGHAHQCLTSIDLSYAQSLYNHGTFSKSRGRQCIGTGLATVRPAVLGHRATGGPYNIRKRPTLGVPKATFYAGRPAS